MIGLDTNVMVRYITQDDRIQSATASRIVDSLTAENPGYLSLVVIAELVWVLEYSYDFDKSGVLKVLEVVLQSEDLVVERAALIWQALHTFRLGSADFADCLIERCNDAANCAYTLTFDREAMSAGMRLLP